MARQDDDKGGAEPPAGTDASEIVVTRRELEVLRLLVEGHSDAEIATRLGLKRRGVSDHISNMLAKTRLGNRTALAVYAVRNNLD